MSLGQPRLLANEVQKVESYYFMLQSLSQVRVLFFSKVVWQFDFP